MSYRENYESWLNSPSLSQEEKAELEAIRGDDKEIESRFFDQLAFGTAGLIKLFRWKFPPDCGTLTTMVISSGFFIHRRSCRYVLSGKL